MTQYIYLLYEYDEDGPQACYATMDPGQLERAMRERYGEPGRWVHDVSLDSVIEYIRDMTEIGKDDLSYLMWGGPEIRKIKINEWNE